MTPELDPDRLADHLDRLYRAAWALCGSREEAEDLVQDTCAKVLTRRRNVDGAPFPYLLQVLRHTFVDAIRRRERRPRTTPIDDVDEARLPTADCALDRMAAREVYAAIAALPEAYRDVVASVDVAGLSYAEAAGALDVPIGTVMSRLYRGRARVAAQLTAASRPAA
jgi:RNA polymerase sigma-70 factor (ECF subfamily)